MSNSSLTPDSFMAQQKGTLTPDSFMAQQTNSQGEQLGFLDRTIPLDSYGNATLSGLQTVGRGVRDAVKGVGAALDPREDASGTGFASVGAAYPIVRMGEGAVDTAKKATQVPAGPRH